MGLIADTEELATKWKSLSPLAKIIAGILLTLNVFNIANIADSIYSLRGFMRFGAQLYSRLTEPLWTYLNQLLPINLSHDEYDLSTLGLITVVTLMSTFFYLRKINDEVIAKIPDMQSPDGFRQDTLQKEYRYNKYNKSRIYLLLSVLIIAELFAAAVVTHYLLRTNYSTDIPANISKLLWLLVPSLIFVTSYLINIRVRRRLSEYMEDLVPFKPEEIFGPLHRGEISAKEHFDSESSRILRKTVATMGLLEVVDILKFTSFYILSVYLLFLVLASIGEGIARPFV